MDAVLMHPADAILVLTIAAIGGLGIVIGYAIAERDRPDETFPVLVLDEDESFPPDPYPESLRK